MYLDRNFVPPKKLPTVNIVFLKLFREVEFGTSFLYFINKLRSNNLSGYRLSSKYTREDADKHS